MDFANMTEEELYAYLSSVGAQAPGSAINYLPGPGDKDSRDYQQDVNDQLTDVLRSSGLFFEDIIPGLPPEVEDPGAYEGFRPDDGAIWQNNQAVNMVLQLVEDENVPYEEALNLVYSKEVPGVPTRLSGSQFGMEGDYDGEAFRLLTTQALQDKARYDREYGDWEAQAAAYDESIRPRSLLEDMGPADERQQELTEADYQQAARMRMENRKPGSVFDTEISVDPLNRRVTVNPLDPSTSLPNPLDTSLDKSRRQAGASRQGGRRQGPEPMMAGLTGDGRRILPNEAGRMVRQNDATVSRPSTGTGRSGNVAERGSKKSRTQRARQDDFEVNPVQQKEFLNKSNRQAANGWNRRARSVQTESEKDRRQRILIQAITSMTGG